MIELLICQGETFKGENIPLGSAFTWAGGVLEQINNETVSLTCH